MSELIRLKKIFSEGTLAGICKQVEEAEAATSGEIVPCVVVESSRYEEALWKFGSLTALLAVTGLFLLQSFGRSPLDNFETLLVSLILGFLGAFLAQRVPAVKRFAVGDRRLAEAALRRARLAFLELEVFKTQERTGVLVFLSLLEHRVVILADSGVSAVVPNTEWENVIKLITSGIRAGKPADGLLAGLKECQKILTKAVPLKAGAVNHDELSGELRFPKDEV